MTSKSMNKFFTIHPNDAGTEAYTDAYVKWLEKRIHELEKQVREKQAALEWYDFDPGNFNQQ